MRNLSVLIIEDEPLIAMMVEDFVDVLGHRVAGIADSITTALEAVARGGFDVAILDVNLRDGACWPVADALAEADAPFVIASGGHVVPPPEAHAGRPHLPKPFSIDGVRAALDGIAARPD